MCFFFMPTTTAEALSFVYTLPSAYAVFNMPNMYSSDLAASFMPILRSNGEGAPPLETNTMKKKNDKQRYLL